MSGGKTDNGSSGATSGTGRLNPGDDAAPGTPGTGEDVCPQCQGKGRLGTSDCPTCGGTGIVIKGVAGG
ncbi:hypothetical protein [Roseomonas harenae]|jgi:DnaJ-class molecular chaperone|uniref:hypothetical protein n=1 Tax=Muricoccus harenae TaxID=2692566 RepID=UPI001331504F|nr:hypothetical protein [Roseomonas harenae]